MKMGIYEWIKGKRERGEPLRLVSLLIDVDNAPLLKKAGKKMVEEGAMIEIDENAIDLETKEGREKLDRLFLYAINKEALDILIERTEMAIRKVGVSEQSAKELMERSNIDPETIDEISAEITKMKQEVIEESKRVAFIKSQFENDENVKDFIDSGSVWFSDKQLALDVIDELEEVKDSEVDNFVTASTLISRIDKLIDRINQTIQKIDLYANGEEIGEEIEGVQELEEDASVTLTTEEASSRVPIEPTQLEELRPKPENEHKNEQEETEDQDKEVSKEIHNDREDGVTHLGQRAKDQEDQEVTPLIIPLP